MLACEITSPPTFRLFNVTPFTAPQISILPLCTPIPVSNVFLAPASTAHRNRNSPNTTTMSDGIGKSVCIIGAGAFGLAALKNFLEEGFEATAYERNSYIGGLWHASGDTTQTTALRGTVSNLSKYMVRPPWKLE